MNSTLGFPLRVTAWIVASALIGCGGGGAHSASLPTTTTTITTNASGSAAGKSVAVKLHFVQSVTKAAKKASSSTRKSTAGQQGSAQSKRTASTRRSPKYVSPSTEGLAIFATDNTTGKALPAVFADVSSSSPLFGTACSDTDGSDLSAGWDCTIQASAVPGHSVTFTAVTVDYTPDNECYTAGPTCQVGYGTGFSYGGELSIGKIGPQVISTMSTTTILMTLDPIVYDFGCDDTEPVVIAADGAPHTMGIYAQAEPEDVDYNIESQQVTGEVFVDPAGTPTALTATSQSPSILYSGSPNQAKIAISGPAVSPGTVTTPTSFTYNGAPNGTADYGADPIVVTFDNNLNPVAFPNTGVPLVGFCSPFDQDFSENDCGNNGQGAYEAFTSVSVVAPFVVSAGAAALGPSLTSAPVTVALYNASSGFGNTIASSPPAGTCSNSQVTVSPQNGGPQVIGNAGVYFQPFIITNVGLTSGSCTFNFIDNNTEISSALITVSFNGSGSGFKIVIPGQPS